MRYYKLNKIYVEYDELQCYMVKNTSIRIHND